ncbi:hypothetical protein SVAN01_07009 [Stagonosporopsis vannaccii]|nr:hypothetical protein SVAN01_07009 [Stagonosporopsis vannaccii]
MYIFNIIQIVIGLLASTVVALPHDLMVNNDLVRDVGVIYSNSNFTGTPLFLLQHKQGRKCETNIAGVGIGSVQICVPATCVLYESKDCTSSGTSNDHYFQGPVDVDNLSNKTSNSYMCGSVEQMSPAISDPAAASTSSEDRHWGIVGR